MSIDVSDFGTYYFMTLILITFVSRVSKTLRLGRSGSESQVVFQEGEGEKIFEIFYLVNTIFR